MYLYLGVYWYTNRCTTPCGTCPWEFIVRRQGSGGASPGSSAGKELACNTGDPNSIPGLGRSPGEGIGYPFQYSWASLVAQTVKNPPAMLERDLHWDPRVGKIPQRRAWQPTPVFLPGESPWTEEPGGLPSKGLQRVGHN